LGKAGRNLCPGRAGILGDVEFVSGYCVVEAELFSMIGKWSEVLRRRTMWQGCTDKELTWLCVRSRRKTRMVHRSMGNHSRMADDLYIKTGWLMLEVFLFFSLYSFSCIAKVQTTLHQQNVNRSGSHTQTSQTLRSTAPVLLSTSRCSQAPLELSKVLSDSTRAFSGAPSRIVKFWSR
jgi:hypothetical protein